VNEERTYKALKGLTREEAEAIYHQIYLKLAKEEGQNTDTGYQAVSLSTLRERVDKELGPYGWPFHKMMNLNNLDFS